MQEVHIIIIISTKKIQINMEKSRLKYPKYILKTKEDTAIGELRRSMFATRKYICHWQWLIQQGNRFLFDFFASGSAADQRYT